jgi:hypothetical protein
VEWSITAGGFAFFALLVTVFVKVFPIMAVYEMVEEREELASERAATEPGPARLAGETP